MNNKELFKKFYLEIAFKNLSSYKTHFNKTNFDENISELISKFQDTYGIDPFDLKDAKKITEYLKENKEPFYTYSEKKGTNIPSALLNLHYNNFLKYYNKNKFVNLQDLINILHIAFGSFCRTFQNNRIELNGNSRVASTNMIFGDVRNDYWTINKGSESELQYHIFKQGNQIGYGLGFNAQKTRNNLDAVENVSKFVGAFIREKNVIDGLLDDYELIDNSIESLINIKEGEFILFGKTFPFVQNKNEIEIADFNFLQIYYDLRYRQYAAYKKIYQNANALNEPLSATLEKNKMEELLEYKKQIILQGPPGTGKTRKAKEIANKLIGTKETIAEDDIIRLFHKDQTIKSAGGKKNYLILEIDQNQKRLKIKRESETEDYTSFSEIISAYQNKLWTTQISQNNPRRAASLAKFIYENNSLKMSNQFKLIQFHPSYTYEDFVRGIVAKPNRNGDGILYEAENKVLGKFAEAALKNYRATLSESSDSNIDLWIEEKFDIFKREIEAKLPETETILSGDIEIFEVTKSYFKYAKNWKTAGYIKFGEFRKLIKAVVKGELELSTKQLDKNLFIHAHYRYTYYNALLKMFFDQFKYENETYSEPLKNFVLIIDEINRANLSSVLGELIYALEYRNECVESPYGIKDDDNDEKENNELILPPNLYIIGTMNTADRSVGHIDYAIRRRFAFVDVLPEELNDDKIIFQKELFKAISALFINNYEAYIADKNTKLERAKSLAAEFRPQDVWLGHSYFIQTKEVDKDGKEILVPEDFNIRLEYEIKPILMEYVKDGILINTIKVGENEIKVEDYIKSL